jgi:fructose-1,6-bisphosphatase I
VEQCVSSYRWPQNEIIKDALTRSGKAAVLASEEDDGPSTTGRGKYVVVFDPLDGSRNIDASIPTGQHRLL